jgi:hypothetical protein
LPHVVQVMQPAQALRDNIVARVKKLWQNTCTTATNSAHPRLQPLSS